MSAVPQDIKRYQIEIHKDFVWDSKRSKIKHTTLIGNYDYGGLRDIDIDIKIDALQASWLKRLLDSNVHKANFG